MPIHHRRGARQCAWRQNIVGGDEQGVLGGGPFQQAFVVRCDVPVVLRVPSIGNAAVATGDAFADLPCIVGRRVVYDQDPDIDMVLIQDASDAGGEKAAVVIAGYNNVDRSHR